MLAVLNRIASHCLAAMLALFALAGCYTGEGSGDIAHRSWPVEPFTKLALSSAADVLVLPGPFQVTASTDDNVLPTLTVSQRDETLILGRDVDWIDGIRQTVPIRFVVKVPQLAAVSTSGSGNVLIRGVGGTSMDFTVSGAGSLDLADLPTRHWQVRIDGAGKVFATGISAETVDVTLRGAARATMYGTTESATVRASGSTRYRGAHLQAEAVAAEVDGAAQVHVWAVQTLNARVGGVGQLGYRGSPHREELQQREGRTFALDLPTVLADPAP